MSVTTPGDSAYEPMEERSNVLSVPEKLTTGFFSPFRWSRSADDLVRGVAIRTFLKHSVFATVVRGVIESCWGRRAQSEQCSTN
jgi:hypothetical protein